MDLRGASADAAADLTAELGTAPTAAMADELFSVSQALRGEGALRRFATDGSLPAEAKAGLMTEIFGSKVAAPTLTLLVSAVAKKWTSGLDLADALEHLSELAVVRSEPVAKRLADELFEVAQLVQETPGLRDALSDPARSIEDKSALIDSILSSKALPGTVTLVKQALAGTYRTVSVALAEYQKVAAAAHDEGVATVRVATPLTDAQTTRLATALAGKYGRPVHINTIIDPTLVGGVKVEIGDDVIDGSVAARVDETTRALAG